DVRQRKQSCFLHCLNTARQRNCARDVVPHEALHKKSLHIDFSVQPLCSLCLCGVFLLGIHQPQRHREHRGCTEKRACMTFCAKPPTSEIFFICDLMQDVLH